MEELYQICSHHLQKLLQNKNKLSLIKQTGLVIGYQQIESKLNKLKQHLLNGQYNLNSLVDLCKVGNVINLDLLSELLINIKYCDYVKSFNDKESINYYEEESTRIVNVINKFMVINFMFNNLIHFLKLEYNCELNGIISDNYYRSKLSVMGYNLLNNKTYFNLSLNFNKAFDYMKNDLFLKEDTLSQIVDDYKFSNVLINEWSLLKDKLLDIKNMLFNIDGYIELSLYKDFINDLIKFIDNRIVKLEPKFAEKVMIKRFKGE